MPLIKSKSKKAFEENLEAEMDSGKSKDQSLAIAYNVQKHSKKKMAKGGQADMEMPEHVSITEAIRRKKMSHGGMVGDESEYGDTMSLDDLDEGDMDLFEEPSEEIEEDKKKSGSMLSKIKDKYKKSNKDE